MTGACDTPVSRGEEWFEISTDVRAGQVRAAWPSTEAPRITVRRDMGTGRFSVLIPDGRVKTWRNSTIYRRYPSVVTKDAPAPAAEAKPTPPAPLAKVREALEMLSHMPLPEQRVTPENTGRVLAWRSAMSEVSSLERVLPKAMQAMHEYRHSEVSSVVRWQDCAQCAALLECTT